MANIFSFKRVNWFLFTLSAIQKLYNNKNVLQDIKVKQVHSNECNFAFVVIFCSFYIFFDVKKYKMKFEKSAAWKNRSSHRRCSIKKGVIKSFAKFKGKHLRRSLVFNKVASLRHFSRTPFLQNTSGRMLLKKVQHGNRRGVTRTITNI